MKGDVGTKLIFENDRVKVWEFTLQPGEAVGGTPITTTTDLADRRLDGRGHARRSSRGE